MRRFVILSVALVLVCACAGGIYAQDIDTLWTRTFWNGYFDSANAVQETSDGGLIVVGGTRFDLTYQYDVFLLKTDADGIEEWSKHFGDPVDYEMGYHVIQTTDGGYLVSACSYGIGDGTPATWIIKTDDTGKVEWDFPFFPNDDNGFPLHATELATGGYAVAGVLNTSGSNEAVLIKLTAGGDLVDYWTYGAYAHQSAEFVAELPGGDLILAGQYDDYYGTGYDYWAWRVTSAGGVVWDSTYAITSYADYLYGACLDDDGLVMTGLARGAGHTYKVDLSGNTVWSKPTSVYFTNEECYSVCPTADSGYMVGGWVGVAGHNRDYNYIKLDADGDTLWSFTVGEWMDDHGHCVTQTSDGNFVMVGLSYSFHSGSCIYLTKIGQASCCIGDRGNVVLDIDDNCSDVSDQTVDIQDLQMLIEHLFLSFAPVCCIEEADIAPIGGPDGVVDIADLQRMVEYLFLTFIPPMSCP